LTECYNSLDDLTINKQLASSEFHFTNNFGNYYAAHFWDRIYSHSFNCFLLFNNTYCFCFLL